jgi:aminoglycoside phosphotransferase (APT) family kinase protein
VSGARGVADLGDVQRRAAQIAASAWPGATVTELHPLPGGTSSLTYLATIAGGPHDSAVVKMAPPGLEPVRNRDVLRQAKILHALGQVPAVKVPDVYGVDPGAPVDVPPMFLMQFAEGESFEPLLAPRDAPRPTEAEIESRAHQAIEMLAAMHRQAPEQIGITDEPEISLTDEVSRWATAFASCPLSEQTTALEQRCHAALIERLPAPMPAAILHGDWRLGNMQCSGTDVHAVIDWEIWSLGDPRIDLAWMLLMSDPDHPSAEPSGGYVTAPKQLLEWYEQAAGAPIANIDWAQALVRYKQAAASALLVKNALKRGESGALVDRMAAGIDGLLAWALTYLS